MVIDYLDINGDLGIANGDFVKGESTLQCMNRLLVSVKGDWRQYPRTGVGLVNFLNDDNLPDLYLEIQEQYKADGLIIDQLQVYNDGRVVEAAHYP